jgi:UDPglucose--hexose-1-phosphate uridylyltransferase
MIEVKPNTAKGATESSSSVSVGDVESRLDPITGNWTIFAPHRVQRPEEFVPQKDFVGKQIECPFCPGTESSTPPPVWIGKVAEDDSSLDILDPSSVNHGTDDSWSVRVVPNKYPAVCDTPGNAAAHRDQSLFQRRPLSGGHEVIIESRSHVESLSQLDLSEIQLVFSAFRDRIRHWRSVPGIGYVTAFKNAGARAGASLRHTHSQLIATDRIPAAVQRVIDRMLHHRASSGCCLHCDLVRGELKARKRIVWHDHSLVAYCPFASHLPMLVRVTTLDHQPSFEDLSDRTIESTARLVGRLVSWLEKIRPGTAYNFCLHTKPPGAADPPDSYHWSIEIFPRMTQIAGFEWGSQCMINPVLPELAASKFRACARSEDPRIML